MERSSEKTLSRRGFLRTVASALAVAAGVMPFLSGALRAEGTEDAQKYYCPICGYVYDPAKGDPTQGIPPGTPFSKLPEWWVCPECGAEKGAFRKWN